MLQRLLMDGIQRCSEHVALRQTRLRETLQNLLTCWYPPCTTLRAPRTEQKEQHLALKLSQGPAKSSEVGNSCSKKKRTSTVM